MDITGIFAFGILSALCAAALKKYAPETALLLAVASGAVIFLTVLGRISPVISGIQSLLAQARLTSDFGVILLKTAGICILCQFVSDSCRQAGQNALAGRIELAARVTVLLIALPLYENILHTATSLIGAA